MGPVEMTMEFPFNEVGDYKLQRLIYEGPFSLVFYGRQTSLERPVLIKVLKPSSESIEREIKRFRQEARVCAYLKHPNIVDVYYLGEQGGYHFMVQEFVQGPNLQDVLKQKRRLDAEETIQIATRMLEALTLTGQRNVVHRDIKPANIMIDHGGHVKLADFGLAQIGNEALESDQNKIVGSPAYMSPEQIMGEPLDVRSDIFALGAVLYELLSAEQAFGGESFAECLNQVINYKPLPLSIQRPDVDTLLADFIHRCLEKDAADRWADPAEALTALRQLADQLAIDTRHNPLVDLILSLYPDKSEKDPIYIPSPEQFTVQFQAPKRNPSWLKAGIPALAAVLLSFGAWQGLTGSNESPEVEEPRFETSKLMLPQDEEMKAPSRSVTDSKDLAGGEEASLVMPASVVQTRSVEESAGEKADAEYLPIIENQDESIDSAMVAMNDSSSTDFANNAPGKIAVSIKPWADIYLDDKKLEEHAVQSELDVEPGEHILTFVHPRFSPRTMPVRVEAGKTTEVNWSFLNSTGFLQLAVRPWADVYLNDEHIEQTPLLKPLQLAAGEHQLELRHPQFPAYNRKITIEAGDTLHVQVSLHNRIDRLSSFE